MSSSSNLQPSAMMMLSVFSTIFSGAFAFASYSSAHPTAFKVAFIAGAVLALIVQAASRGEESSGQEARMVGLGVFSLTIAAGGGFFFTMHKIFDAIFPPTYVRNISRRSLNTLGGFSLGYAAANLLVEFIRNF